MKFTTQIEVTHMQEFEIEGDCFKTSEGNYYIPLREPVEGKRFLFIGQDEFYFCFEFLEENWNEIQPCDRQEGIETVQKRLQIIQTFVDAL